MDSKINFKVVFITYWSGILICWIQFQSRITLDKFSSEHVDYILVPKLILSPYIELIIMQNYSFFKDYDLMHYTYHVLNERDTCIITFVMWTRINIAILTLENDWNCATDGAYYFFRILTQVYDSFLMYIQHGFQT
jgi:hypothetical protein